MARVRVKVSEFYVTWEGVAYCDEDIYGNDSLLQQVGEKARDLMEVVEATYDEPEPEDTSKTEVDDEMS